jgi:hypothetical protein
MHPLCFRHRRLLPWLLLVGLGGCQRATYSFNAVASARLLSELALAADTSSKLAPARSAQSLAVARVPKQPAAYQVTSRRAAAQAHRRRLRPLRRLPRVVSVQPRASRQPLHSLAPACVEPGRHRSRTIAILLAILSITYVPLSLYNFYLGYYGRGLAAIGLEALGLYLLVVGSAGFVFGAGGLSALGLIGAILLAGWFVWQLVDVINIIRGDLKPNGGDYGRKVFTE